MSSYVKITDGVVVQKQPYAEPGFIEATDDVVCGVLYDGETFSNPPPVAAPPAPLALTDECSALLTVTDGEVSNVTRTKEIGGAFSFGGTAYVYFMAPFPDTSYIAICNAAVVKFPDRVEVPLAGLDTVKLIIQQVG